MGKLFDNCVDKGGDIKTESLSKNRYQRICTLDGKTFASEIKTRLHPKRPRRK